MAKEKTIGDKFKENPWIVSTLVLGVVAIVLIFSSFFSGFIPSEKAGQEFVNFINSQGGPQIEYVSIDSFGPSLYQVTVLADGKEVPAHITQDGKYFVQIVAPIGPEETEPEVIETTLTSSNVPKSDKPVVELFIMSYCPYGTMAEKGIIPALNALGDTVDFNLRFVYYAMHPTQGEVEEQLNEYCIQKEQEDKLIDYLTCFLQEGNRSACIAEVGIDENKLTACTEAADTEFDITVNLEDESSWLSGRFPMFDIDKQLNQDYGVKGSPTLVVNGVVVQSGRDPAAYLDAICGGFNEAPEECEIALSSTSYSPGFGYDTTSAGSTASCG